MFKHPQQLFARSFSMCGVIFVFASLLFIASNQMRRGHSQGRFRITLHSDFEGPAFWSSPWWSWSKDRLQDRLQWTDVELDKSKVHPGIQCLVVRVWFCPVRVDSACIKGTIQQSQQPKVGQYFHLVLLPIGSFRKYPKGTLKRTLKVILGMCIH